MQIYIEETHQHNDAAVILNGIQSQGIYSVA